MPAIDLIGSSDLYRIGIKLRNFSSDQFGKSGIQRAMLPSFATRPKALHNATSKMRMNGGDAPAMFAGTSGKGVWLFLVNIRHLVNAEDYSNARN